MLNKPDKPKELRDLDWAGNPDAIFSTPIHDIKQYSMTILTCKKKQIGCWVK